MKNKANCSYHIVKIIFKKNRKKKHLKNQIGMETINLRGVFILGILRLNNKTQCIKCWKSKTCSKYLSLAKFRPTNVKLKESDELIFLYEE